MAGDPGDPKSTDRADAVIAAATPDEDEDRAAILARRRALIRRSIASVGALVGGLATADCAPAPCLTPAVDARPQLDGSADAADSRGDDVATDSASDAGGMDAVDASGSDAAADTPSDAFDASPMPCLSPPIDTGLPVDTGAPPDDAMPMPCLRVAPDAGGD